MLFRIVDLNLIGKLVIKIPYDYKLQRINTGCTVSSNYTFPLFAFRLDNLVIKQFSTYVCKSVNDRDLREDEVHKVLFVTEFISEFMQLGINVVLTT